MKGPRRWIAVVLLGLLQLSPLLPARQEEERRQQDRSRGKRKRGGKEEFDEDVVFAAELLGLVYDRVRDTGDLLRIVGDTAGGLSGGAFKLLSASVNGLSSVLDAASRGLKANVRPRNAHFSAPSATAEAANNHDAGSGSATRVSSSPDDPGNSSQSSGNAPGAKGETRGKGEGEAPDPFDRIGSVALTSLAGSLKILSTAVGGIGDAVFQAGVVAEGLAGGTGQVAEDTVRLVQRFVGWARDDIVKLNNRKHHGHDSRKTIDAQRPGQSPSAMPGGQASAPTHDADTNKFSPGMVSVSGGLTMLEAWKGIRNLGRFAVEAAVRVGVALFRRKNGALPPAPRFAVLIVLAILVYGRRRRQHQPSPAVLYLPEAVAAVARTPRRNSVARQDLQASHDWNGGSPSAAAAAGLYSPSRNLFSEQQQGVGTSPVRAPLAPGSPSRTRMFGVLPLPDGLDPSLPSPAQARAALARTSRASSLMQGLTRGGGGERDVVERGERWVPTTTSGLGLGERTLSSERRGWGCWRVRWWTRCRGPQNVGGGGGRGGGRRYVLWLVVLWLVASVLEERERDRVAWLAWDEGYLRGQASRAVDPTVEAETTAWLNHIITNVWGGTKGTPVPQPRRKDDVRGDCSFTGIFASDGLSSFVAEHLTEGFLEALGEMKPTSVVGVELLDVELGSSAPRILGIKMLDPASVASPGWGDGRCSRGECVSFRLDLQVATQDLRVGVKVKLSSLEKALLPTGTVRLLELFFRGSVLIRAELRDEFPFVNTAFVAFDDPPDVQVRLEQWGLDAFTLGAVPAAVDEMARIALQQALAPYVLPGFMEVDAASALCPECPAIQVAGKAAGTDVRLPSSRLPAAAAAAFASSTATGGITSSRTSPGTKEKPVDKGRRRLGSKSGSTASSANDRHRGTFSSQDSHRSAFEGDGDGSGRNGRAAAMANSHEHRGGKIGFVRWLKDSLSDVITSNERREDGRQVMDWDGMD